MRLQHHSDPDLVRQMVVVLHRYDAARTESDALRCLIKRFSPLDVALFALEARALALAA